DIAVLQQGLRNANDGTSILQTIDGGLNNISNILNSLQTLATQSASGTFSGSRATLNQQFTALLGEIDRQAANIGLASGASTTTAAQYHTAIQVFIGGGSSQNNSAVSIDLSASGNVVDTSGLGISSDAVDTVAHAKTALTHLTSAVSALGLVQGAVGTGEN